MRPLNLIVIHCSATANGRAINRGKETPADVINLWHKARGFNRSHPVGSATHLQSIGYHWVIDVDGSIYNGRDQSEVGAHTAGRNSDSVAVCLIGTDQFTLNQWASLASLVRSISAQTLIPLSFASPLKNKPVVVGRRGICGHRDLSPDKDGDGLVTGRDWLKLCPGFSVYTWLSLGLKPPAGSVHD